MSRNGVKISFYLALLAFLGSFIILSIINLHYTFGYQHSGENVSILNNTSLSQLRIGSISGTPDFDPFTAESLADYYRNSLMYDCLINRDKETGELTSGLARQWVVNLQSNYWRFYLYEDILFHDGSELNATIVKWNLDRLTNSSHPAYVEKNIRNADLQILPLQSVVIEDDYIVSLYFSTSYAPFYNHQATFLLQILSPNSFNSLGNLVHPIGTGPYQYDSATSNATAQKFNKFSNHFRGIAPFPEIEFICYSDFSKLKTAIDTGKVDFLPFAGWDWFNASTSGWTITRNIIQSRNILGIFNYDTPELGNDKVRLALNYAIDKAQLINQFSPTELVEETTNLLPSGIETRESLNGFPYDRDYAKSLLNESGYSVGSDGYRAYLTLVANISLSPITSIIQTDLEAVGINLTIITNNVPSLVQSGNFDIYIEDFIHIQDPDLISPFVTSTGNLNFGSWSFQLDDWVDLGRITPARQERDYYYKQAQLQIQEKAPLLFLLDRIDYFASLESFKDYVWLDSSGYRIGFDYTISNNNPGIKSKILKRSNVQGCTPSCTVDNWYIGPEGTNCASDQTKLYNSDTDVEIESTQVCLTFVIKKTYELTNLGSTLPQQSGIFYKVSVDIDSENYKIKCSYSGNEINEKLDGLDLCKLALFKRKSGNWKEINTYDHSTRDRFVTVEVKGDKILSLQECYEECHCSTNLPLFSFSSVFVLILVRKRVNKN